MPLDQFNTHLLRQKGVFKVGTVVHARRQHYHCRLGRSRRTAGTQRLQQQIGVMGNGRDAVGVEQLGKQPHHHLAVFQHVAHAAGDAQIVFQHVILAIAVGIGCAHDIDTGDVGVDLVWHIHAHHLGAELRIVVNLVARHDTGLDDVLVVVNVVDETVKCRDPLHQTFLHAGPLVGGNDAGDQVKRNQPLGAGSSFVLLSIDSKGDTDPAEDHLGLFPPLGHHVAGLARQPFVVDLVMVPDLLALGKELVRQTGVHLVELLHRTLS